MLTILLATCEVTLRACREGDLRLGADLVADLERVVERTRAELEATTPAPGAWNRQEAFGRDAPPCP